MLELRVYRWKEDKSYYLYNLIDCFDSFTEDRLEKDISHGFRLTKDLLLAIKSTKVDDFVHHLNECEGVYHVLSKDFTNEEGYKGTLCKEICIPMSDFELVVLREVIN